MLPETESNCEQLWFVAPARTTRLSLDYKVTYHGLQVPIVRFMKISLILTSPTYRHL